MSGAPRPLACDLSVLDPAGRRREQELLARFRRAAREIAAGRHWVRFALAADAGTLAALAELLAYERLCCPFLEFRLTVPAADRAEVEIAAAPDADRSAPVAGFVRAEFGPRAPG